MYTCNIHVSIQFPAMLSEIPFDVERAELAIEDGVSLLLMELFGGTIFVNDVTIKYSDSEHDRDDDFSRNPD